MRIFGEAKTNENENVSARIATPRIQPTAISWQLFCIVLGFIAVVWVSAILYTGYRCAKEYNTVCVSQQIAFWSIPALTFGASIGASGAYILRRWHEAQTAQYLNTLSQHVSYKNIRQFEKLIIETVAIEVAKSLASADMDTYSPSNSQSAPVQPADQTNNDPLKAAKVSIADIFMVQKD